MTGGRTTTIFRSWPGDGFISLDAGEAEGTVLTKPFLLPGTELFVNVNTPHGEISGEVLDGDGNVVTRSRRLTGDLLHEQVHWQDCDIADLRGHTARLRFALRSGQFYSYWLE